MRPLIEDIFRSQARWVRVYTGIEEIIDPFEGTVTVQYLNPIPIRAIIEDFTTTQMQWKMPGIKTSNAKELFIESKYRPLIEMSQKIEFNGDMYEGWRENGKMQIREQSGAASNSARRYGGYIKLYIFTKGL